MIVTLLVTGFLFLVALSSGNAAMIVGSGIVLCVAAMLRGGMTHGDSLAVVAYGAAFAVMAVTLAIIFWR